MVVSDVPEFESSVKVAVAPFSVTLDSTFARNFGITGERWVVRVRRRLYRFSGQNLRKDGAHLQKFSKRPILANLSYYIVRRFFLGQFNELVRFTGNVDYGGFRGAQIQRLHQNSGNTIFGASRPDFCRKLFFDS